VRQQLRMMDCHTKTISKNCVVWILCTAQNIWIYVLQQTSEKLKRHRSVTYKVRDIYCKCYDKGESYHEKWWRYAAKVNNIDVEAKETPYYHTNYNNYNMVHTLKCTESHTNPPTSNYLPIIDGSYNLFRELYEHC